MERFKAVMKFTVLLAMVLAYAGCSSSSERRSTSTYMDDKVIAAKIKTDLIGDPLTKAHQIDVNVYKGVVELSGFVDTPEAVHRAAEIARNTKGVVDVKNDLIVK